MNKFLLIGSAPYIKKWYEKYALNLIKNNYKLCVMNNAWAIDPKNVYLWLYPCDFFDTGKLFPNKQQRKNWKEYIFDHRIITKLKYNYNKEGKSGTMLLNVLIYLLNKSIEKNQKCEVLISGCDCIYEKKKSHFYGVGTSDPLRYGKIWLIKELNRIKSFYEKEKCLIYNVGNRRKTLLPFKRKRI